MLQWQTNHFAPAREDGHQPLHPEQSILTSYVYSPSCPSLRAVGVTVHVCMRWLYLATSVYMSTCSNSSKGAYALHISVEKSAVGFGPTLSSCHSGIAQSTGF